MQLAVTLACDIYSCFILLMLTLTLLQTLCAVVQHHMQLIRQLQQQMWVCLGSAAQASSTAVLVGLQQQYMRTAGALLSNASPCSMTGRQAALFQHIHIMHTDATCSCVCQWWPVMTSNHSYMVHGCHQQHQLDSGLPVNFSPSCKTVLLVGTPHKTCSSCPVSRDSKYGA